MKALFSHSIDVLVKAYLNNTLEHVNCYACAVGNLIADVTNEKYVIMDGLLKWKSDKFPDWYDYICGFNILQGKRDIESTGYSIEDVKKIERAFETADRGNSNDDWMFNGLMAVVDVLADIHGVDLETKEIAKSKFQMV